MELNYSIEDLESFLDEGCSLQGQIDPNTRITGMASLTEAQPGDATFLYNPKYKDLVPKTKASVVIVPTDYTGEPQEGQVFVKVPDPVVFLSNICRMIEQYLWPKPEPGIHPSAVIHPDAEVDESAHVGPLCTVSAGAKVGKDTILEAGVHLGKQACVGKGCWIMPQVRILDYCQVGDRVRLHSGVVLGSDGYGYRMVDGRHEKIPQVGKVIVENDVEIGANTTIDRARFDITKIGEGTKIDNLVQIGHNVIVGKHCLIISQAGIAGSTVLEDYVVVGGQVGIVDHVKIGKGAMIGSQSGVNSDVDAGSKVRGSPAYSYMLAQRLDILKKRLPDFFERLKRLEETVESLQPTK